MIMRTTLKNEIREVEFEKEIYGEIISEKLAAENINEILTKDWLQTTQISLYIRYLYHTFVVPGSLITKFSFISPHNTSTYSVEYHSQKITDAFKVKGKRNMLFLAPHNPGQHWVLVCINPFVPVIYYLDSLRDSDFKNYKSMRILFNQAVARYRGGEGLPPNTERPDPVEFYSWKRIKNF
ncbi:uncharacterized protein LOC129292225 [Prosopis cineraria]|uniref:uncharacterized protein LOC129292225 n=1 Tax=Prosopis cineraria TaxID=364024 RepID=UPI0024102271|nr:uncharacterized protein LOC129292225 [Prosopis cineraria]